MPRIINLANASTFQATSLTDGGYLPGPRIIPNACMVRLNWTLTDGKIGHNVLYATYSGTPALSNAVAESIRTGITTGAAWTGLAAMLATSAALASVSVLDVRSSTGTEFTSTGAASAGTGVGTAFPDESALVVTARTAQRGPANRGRFYVPGWCGAAGVAGGTASSTAVTALSTWAQLVQSTIASVIGAMVLAHPARQAYTSLATGRVFPARAAGTVPITSLSVRNNTWDSQRRRGLK